MNDAEALRQEAADDRRKAEELYEDNPMYSDYLQRRASWKEFLAVQEEAYERDGSEK